MAILKPHFKALRALLAVLVISVLASGCTTKIAYNFLDWGMYWKLKDYVKFNPDQRLQVKNEIAQLIDWHRSEELPQYATQLEKLSIGLESGITADQLEVIYDDLRQSWQRIVIKALPAAINTISSLNDQQISEFFEMLVEKEADDAKAIEDGTRAQTAKKREAYVTKKLVEVIGKLDAEQKALIAQWAQQMHPTKAFSLVQAIKWRTKMQLALAQRQDKAQLAKDLTALFANPNQLRSARYRDVMEKNKQLVMQLMFDLNQTFTSQQRRKLIKKLNGYIKDFRELSV